MDSLSFEENKINVAEIGVLRNVTNYFLHFQVSCIDDGKAERYMARCQFQPLPVPNVQFLIPDSLLGPKACRTFIRSVHRSTAILHRSSSARDAEVTARSDRGSRIHAVQCVTSALKQRRWEEGRAILVARNAVLCHLGIGTRLSCAKGNNYNVNNIDKRPTLCGLVLVLLRPDEAGRRAQPRTT
jgi:hypothetical protein